MPYKKANIILAFFYMLFNKRRYIQMAQDHDMWVNIKEEDLKIKYDNGTFPEDGWREENAPRVANNLTLMKRALLKSFFITLLIALAVLLFGLSVGSLDLKLGTNFVKAISFTGGCVAAWGAVFQLTCPDIETYKKQSLNEIMQKSIFFILFVLGLFISLSSLVL